MIHRNKQNLFFDCIVRNVVTDYLGVFFNRLLANNFYFKILFT